MAQGIIGVEKVDEIFEKNADQSAKEDISQATSTRNKHNTRERLDVPDEAQKSKTDAHENDKAAKLNGDEDQDSCELTVLWFAMTQPL